MDYFWFTLGALLLLIGFVGCLVPAVPGPVFGFLALVALLPTPVAPSMTLLAVAAGVLAVVVALDYMLPALGAKQFDCSRWGVVGCLVGTFVGVFFFPFGLVLGPFLGAVLGELLAGKRMAAAMCGGLGALLGFLAVVVLKFCALGFFATFFVRAVRAFWTTAG